MCVLSERYHTTFYLHCLESPRKEHKPPPVCHLESFHTVLVIRTIIDRTRRCGDAKRSAKEEPTMQRTLQTAKKCRDLDTPLQKVRDESYSNWCHKYRAEWRHTVWSVANVPLVAKRYKSSKS